MGFTPEITRDRPRAIIIMPRVAMKGGTLMRADDEAVDQPTDHAGRQAGDNTDRNRQARVGDGYTGHDCGECHDRADGQIDAACDNDEGHAQSQYAIDAGGEQNAKDVVLGEEVGRKD